VLSLQDARRSGSTARMQQGCNGQQPTVMLLQTDTPAAADRQESQVPTNYSPKANPWPVLLSSSTLFANTISTLVLTLRHHAQASVPTRGARAAAASAGSAAAPIAALCLWF
jgi:hypothetical protein